MTNNRLRSMIACCLTVTLLPMMTWNLSAMENLADYAFYTNWKIGLSLDRSLAGTFRFADKLADPSGKSVFKPDYMSTELILPYGFLGVNLSVYKDEFRPRDRGYENGVSSNTLIKSQDELRISLFRSWRKGAEGHGIIYTHAYGNYRRTDRGGERFWNDSLGIYTGDSRKNWTNWTRSLSEEIAYEFGQKPWKGGTFHTLKTGLQYSHWVDVVVSRIDNSADPASPFPGTNISSILTTFISQPENQFKLFCDWKYDFHKVDWFHLLWSLGGAAGWAPSSCRTRMTNRYFQTSGLQLANYDYVDTGNSFVVNASANLDFVTSSVSLSLSFDEQLVLSSISESLVWRRGGNGGTVDYLFGRVANRQNVSGYFIWRLDRFTQSFSGNLFKYAIHHSTHLKASSGDNLGSFNRETVTGYQDFFGFDYKVDIGYLLSLFNYDGKIAVYYGGITADNRTENFFGAYLTMSLELPGWNRARSIRHQLRAEKVSQSLARADAYFDQKKYYDAFMEYNDALAVEPGKTNIIYKVAAVYSLSGDSESTLWWLRKLFKIDKNYIRQVQTNSSFHAITMTTAFTDIMLRSLSTNSNKPWGP